MSINIGVVDYHAGNIHSVVKALNYIGVQTKLIIGPMDINRVDGVIIPGVGAFGAGKSELVSSGLFDRIKEYAGSGSPILGICLGMQLLFDESEEFGSHAGLGLIPGRVVAVPEQFLCGIRYKVPHIGWSGLRMDMVNRLENRSILAGVKEGEELYFIHSYMAVPEKKESVLAYTDYGGCKIAAVVQKGNIYGCQFHPEKSRETGINILRNFAEISGAVGLFEQLQGNSELYV